MIWTELIKHLKEAAVSGISFATYVILIIAFVYYRTKNSKLKLLLKSIKDIPEQDRKPLIERQLMVKVRDNISARDYLKLERNKYIFICFIAFLVCVLAVYFQASSKKDINSIVSTIRINGIIYDDSQNKRPLKGAYIYVLHSNKKDSSSPRITGSDGKFFIDIDTGQSFRATLHFGKDSFSDNIVFNTNDFLELHLKTEPAKVPDGHNSEKSKGNRPNIVNNGNAKTVIQADKIDKIDIKQ
jgi:hypothetical protein